MSGQRETRHMIDFMLMKEIALALIITCLLSSCIGTDSNLTTLIVYSPHGKELLTEYEKGFELENPSIDVRWLDMGSQDVLDRIRSERSNPQADVWFGAPATMFSQAAKENLLVEYLPTWADSVDEDGHGPDDFWYGTYQTPEVISYNTNLMVLRSV